MVSIFAREKCENDFGRNGFLTSLAMFFEKCMGLVQAFTSVSLGFNRRCMPKSLSYNSFEYLNAMNII